MGRTHLFAAALVALAGCNSTGATGDVKLGVDIAALQGSIANAVTGGTNDGSLSITRVRVLVAHAKVGYIHEQATGPAAEIGPIVVDLTADEIASGAHRDFDLGKLPTGTYGGAEIEIESLDAAADTSDPALADFVSSKASVLVEGTYQGAAFTFAGHFLAEQGTDGDVSVDAATPVSLALTVDPSKWFVDTSGAAVNPADATQHDTLAVAMCKTLDTQPQVAPSGGATSSSGTAPSGGGKHGGGPGGGNGAHCVEAAQ